MKNEILKSDGSQFPTQFQVPTTVTASDNGIAVGNLQGNLVVEGCPETLAQAISLVMQQQSPMQQKSHSVEWIKLDRTHFHLFVLNNEDYSGSSFSISTESSLKYTDSQLREYYSPLSDRHINELLKMPCLFTVKNESFQTAFQDCPSFLGRLTKIQPQPGRIIFNYEVFETTKYLLQETINNNTQDFHLISANVRNQLDEEHWSIRHGDLIQITKDKGIEVK